MFTFTNDAGCRVLVQIVKKLTRDIYRICTVHSKINERNTKMQYVQSNYYSFVNSETTSIIFLRQSTKFSLI